MWINNTQQRYVQDFIHQGQIQFSRGADIFSFSTPDLWHTTYNSRKHVYFYNRDLFSLSFVNFIRGICLSEVIDTPLHIFVTLTYTYSSVKLVPHLNIPTLPSFFFDFFNRNWCKCCRHEHTAPVNHSKQRSRAKVKIPALKSIYTLYFSSVKHFSGILFI